MLGAGSTIGTFGRSLGVDGFVRRLIEVRGPEWATRYPELALAVKDSRSCNLDRVWTHVDYTGKLQRSLCPRLDCGMRPVCNSADCPAKKFPNVSGQLRKALIDAYALNDEIDMLQMNTVFTLKTVLGGLGDGDALISFNWDTAAERIARKLSIPLLAAGRPPLHGCKVNLIKPHGSLSWQDHGANDLVRWRSDGGEPLFDPMHVDLINQCGSPLQPLVLGAVPIKDELLGQTQPNQSLYTVIADQWAAALSAIQSAAELVVVGYGFPPEDAYGRFLFREAARRRGDQPPPEVSYYALPQDLEKMQAAFRDIFGDDVRCVFEGPVCGPDPGSRTCSEIGDDCVVL
jgi:hypothetical protein